MKSEPNLLIDYFTRLSVVVLSIAILGCEEPPIRYPVAGKVLIDGQPLQEGSIRFVPKAGRPFTSTVMEDGSFELSEDSISTSEQQLGVFPGSYRVSVSAFKVVNEGSNEVDWLAPSKYADFRTSGIEVDVTGPKEDLEIELTWAGDEQSEDASADEAKERLGIEAGSDTEAGSEDVPEDSASDLSSQDEEAPVTK